MLELQLQQQAKTAVWNARSVLGIILLSLESRPFVRRPWRVASASSRTAHRPTIYLAGLAIGEPASGDVPVPTMQHARMRRMRDSLRVPTAPRAGACSLCSAQIEIPHRPPKQCGKAQLRTGRRPSVPG